MNITHLKPNFEDARGAIQDLVTEDNLNAVTLITYTKGAIRANHFHEHTIQWDYVISGSLESYSREGFEGETAMKVITAGDLVKHPIGEHHALRALEDSVTLAIVQGPRAGEDYENDVVRLEGEQKLVS